jgi:FkbM family methyltransferase
MIGAIKAALRRTPLFPPHFARQHAPQVLEWTERDGHWAAFYSQFVNPGDTVFDVGANIGHQTKIFLHLGCRVIAVEPQTICIKTLERAFGNKITIVPIAVSNTIGACVLYSVDGASQQSSISPDWINTVQQSGRFKNLRWNMTQQIQRTTFSELVGRFGIPAFIKIDIQGHEAEALASLKHRVPALSFEVTPEYAPNALQCLDLLSALGPYKFNHSFLDSAKFEFSDWQSADQMRRYLTDITKSRPSVGDVYARLEVHQGRL